MSRTSLARREAFYERSNVSLLAQEPSDVEEDIPSKEDQLNWHILHQHCEQRLNQMRSWRISWWEHWATLAEYILPRRYIWLVTANNMNRGFQINQSIVDSTGTLAMRVCSSGLMSGLTSPSRPWFKLKPAHSGQLDRDAQLWFDEVERLIYQVMAQSNFYDSIAQMHEDNTVFGTAPMIVYEDEQEVIRCYNPVAGEYFLGSSFSNRSETFCRYFTMTIMQIVEMFGVKNLPVSLQEIWKEKGSGLESERIIAHIIEPNAPLRGASDEEIQVVEDKYPWREAYWVYGEETDKPLSVRGFDDTPVVVARWSSKSNDPYGRSPAMDALPDIMQLQIETKRKGEAIEKHVRPPLLASVELKNEPSSILPGHVTYVSNLGPQSGMRPIYEVQPQLEHMVADLQQIQERIKKAFFNDLFLMLSESTKEMTAFEVAQRQQEKLQVLGPVIERIQNEVLSPIIKRIYRILTRKKLLPPFPATSGPITLDIEYISILAVAQRAAATAGMERWVAMIGNLAAVRPEAVDNIDIDAFIREYGELLALQHKVMTPVEQMKKIRAARAQQMQQMQQQQQMMMASEQLPKSADAAQTLSQTKVGGGQSALDMMLGSGGGSNYLGALANSGGG